MTFCMYASDGTSYSLCTSFDSTVLVRVTPVRVSRLSVGSGPVLIRGRSSRLGGPTRGIYVFVTFE